MPAKTYPFPAKAGQEEQRRLDAEEHDQAHDEHRGPLAAQVEGAGLGRRHPTATGRQQEADGLQHVRREEGQRGDAQEVVERLLVDQRGEQHEHRDGTEAQDGRGRGLALGVDVPKGPGERHHVVARERVEEPGADEDVGEQADHDVGQRDGHHDAGDDVAELLADDLLDRCARGDDRGRVLDGQDVDEVHQELDHAGRGERVEHRARDDRAGGLGLLGDVGDGLDADETEERSQRGGEPGQEVRRGATVRRGRPGTAS